MHELALEQVTHEDVLVGLACDLHLVTSIIQKQTTIQRTKILLHHDNCVLDQLHPCPVHSVASILDI